MQFRDDARPLRLHERLGGLRLDRVGGADLDGSDNMRPRARIGAYLIVFAAFHVVAGYGGWFGVDAWDFITRLMTTIDGWTAPHGAHWPAVQSLILRWLYLAVGLDFWPWYMLVPALATVAVGAGTAWSVRRRGGTWAVAGAAVVATTMMLQSLEPAHFGPAVGVLSVVTVLTLMGTSRRRTAMFAGLLGVAANPIGVVGVAVASVGGIVDPSMRSRGWWWPPLVPLGVYGVWRAVWGPVSRGSPTSGAGPTVEGLRFLREATSAVTGLTGLIALVVGVCVLLAVAWTIRRGRVDTTGLLLLAVAGLIVGATVLLRGGHAYGRWGGQVGVLLVVAVAPAVTSRLLAGTVALVVALAQVGAIREAWPRAGLHDQRRAMFAAGARLVDEPAAPGRDTVHYGLFGLHLTDATLVSLVTNGHEPAEVTRRQLEAARGGRRVRPWPAGQPSGEALAIDGCAAVPPDTGATWEVIRPGTVVLQADPSAAVSWTWTDDFGLGRGSVPESMVARRGGRVALHLAPPSGPTLFAIEHDGPLTAHVCVTREALAGLQREIG